MTDKERTEVDMGYVQGFVNLIAQALIAATELPKQIELMQNDLGALHTDLERTKARNIELDTLLNDTRRQRDEAEQALSGVRAELATTKYNYDQASQSLANAQGGIERLNQELEHVKKERDQYGLDAMAAEDRAKAAEAKLDKLREAMGMPKEVPQPVVVQPQVFNPQVDMPNPEPPKPEPERIYEGDPGFNERSYTNEHFDNVQGRYYRTA